MHLAVILTLLLPIDFWYMALNLPQRPEYISSIHMSVFFCCAWFGMAGSGPGVIPVPDEKFYLMAITITS